MTNASIIPASIHHGIDRITHRAFHEQVRFVKASGLSMPQFTILMQLHYQRQCGVSDIGARMDITSAAASQLVEKLVQADLLERSEDPLDRRAKQLRLTEKGRALVETSQAERHRWVNGLMETLSPADLQKVSAAMEILATALQFSKPDKLSKAD
jgi:DNA-binding MarR family transcriptional regulator